MTLIAHLADIHLGKAQYHYAFREEDIYGAFREAVEKILEEHIEAVVVSGDVFDNPRPPNRAILKFRDIVEPLHKKNTPVIAVRGDHDTPKTRDRGVLEIVSSIHDNIKLLDPVINTYVYKRNIKGEKIEFWGAPYVPPAYRKELYGAIFAKIEKNAEKNAKKILVGHFPLKDYIFFEQSLEKSQLPKNIDYYALGHIHDRIQDRFGEKSIIAYPGSLEIMDKKEIDIWRRKGKGFYIVDLSGNQPRIEKIDLNIRPQYAIRNSYPEILNDIREWLDRFKGKGRKPVLHLEVFCNKGEAKKAESNINQIIGDKAYTRITIREKRIEDLRKTLLGSTGKEEDLVAHILGDHEIARLLVKLKDCFSTTMKCDHLIKEILEKKSYWERRIGGETRSTKPKQGIGLYRYIG